MYCGTIMKTTARTKSLLAQSEAICSSVIKIVDLLLLFFCFFELFMYLDLAVILVLFLFVCLFVCVCVCVCVCFVCLLFLVKLQV